MRYKDTENQLLIKIKTANEKETMIKQSKAVEVSLVAFSTSHGYTSDRCITDDENSQNITQQIVHNVEPLQIPYQAVKPYTLLLVVPVNILI